jgi:hypothetical protein
MFSDALQGQARKKRLCPVSARRTARRFAEFLKSFGIAAPFGKIRLQHPNGVSRSVS